ncbi:hypothetical protein P775_09765 [Puniceibacterium antarcticum]|uniref:Winged helix-turn-helix domain-containing protein n=2 Tax=Puniceibacterium antarcticum TaxID=1206336 RepID=A0A2G8RFP1_9RHOB|nr:hypothetical protein P775_09765 [Puniceibacterium antarcticum]
MRRAPLTPCAEALAYRIWGYAKPRAWDVSIGDLALALDVDRRRIGIVCARKGWTTRLRASPPTPGAGASFEDLHDLLV